VYVIEPTPSHVVPQQHFPNNAHGVLLVDRSSVYKARAQGKDGTLVLACCWAQVRRDFVRVGTGWPALKAGALAWLPPMRERYRWNGQGLEQPAAAAAAAGLRQAGAALPQQSLSQLADPSLGVPCRKVLGSLHEHWSGWTLFVAAGRIPLDNNRSERRWRGPAVGRKNYDGSGALWSGGLAALRFWLVATRKVWRLKPPPWSVRWKTPICVGGPNLSCSGPTGRNRTV
jgi:transposase